MLERERILAELWSRMSEVTGVAYTARNPKAPPNTDDLPAIQFFEFDDEVEEASSRGGYPSYKRTFDLILEVFIAGSSESSSSKELGAFVQEVKKKLYAGGPTLGKTCSFKESKSTRVLRPPAGENVAGIGIKLEIRYVEDIAALFI